MISSDNGVFEGVSGDGEMSDSSTREVSLETSKEIVIRQVILKIELEFLGKGERGLRWVGTTHTVAGRFLPTIE